MTGIYEPKAKFLISVGRCVWKRRFWKGSCLFNSGFVGGRGNLMGDIFYWKRRESCEILIL